MQALVSLDSNEEEVGEDGGCCDLMTLQKVLVAAAMANTVVGDRLGRTYFEGFGKGERRNLAWLPGVWLG